MDGIAEVVKVSYFTSQDWHLEQAFKDFYKLDQCPKIHKDLYVTKSSYHKFMTGRLKERTPYEPDKKFGELEWDSNSLPFDICYAKVEFKFPSGRTVTLTELLKAPNGLIRHVEVAEEGKDIAVFDSYIQAEAEVVTRFLADGVVV